jgi:acetyl-CoA carboxylase carboxyl transferase subunit alpha
MAAARHYLDFEQPIADLESKIDELSEASENAGANGFDTELAALRERVSELRREAYAALDPWRKTQVARHPDRPHTSDYIAGLIDDYVELRGDRAFADDQAIVGGLGRFRGTPVVVMGHEKGRDTAGRLKHNFGLARPEGFRKAVRLMDLADRFNMPVLTFVDTSGAYPGRESEERGVAEAIARTTERGLTLGVPVVTTITGEGGSGGAIALAAANRVLILEHSIYSIISPEGCAAILWRDRAKAADAAAALKITPDDLIQHRVVDRIIIEPEGGAHADPDAVIKSAGDAIEEELHPLLTLAPDVLRRHRAERFYAIGRVAVPA